MLPWQSPGNIWSHRVPCEGRQGVIYINIFIQPPWAARGWGTAGCRAPPPPWLHDLGLGDCRAGEQASGINHFQSRALEVAPPGCCPPFVPVAAPRMLGELWLSSPRWCQPRPPSWHRRCPKSVLPSGSRAGWQQRGRGSHFLLCRQPGSGHGAAPPLGFWSSMSSSQGKAARPQSLEAAPGLGAFSPPCFARRAGGKLCAPWFC